MNLFLSDQGWTDNLAAELSAEPSAESSWVQSELRLSSETRLGFARQLLPDARRVEATAINGWANLLVDALLAALPNHPPWRWHLWSSYGEGTAGRNRVELIRRAVIERLKKRRRHLLKNLRDVESPFSPDEALVQTALLSPDQGWLSIGQAPLPFDLRALISPFIAGDVPIAEDKAAPSRAFAKLVEAERRLGQFIASGDTVVDLGASPGSWSYVALNRGARVTAVDRSPLRDDLMRNPNLTFAQADAFKFKPSSGTVDWLICDVIAAPQRSMELLVEWLAEGLMRHFVVTLKFKGTDDYPLLKDLTASCLPLCADFRLTRLCANKNEVTAFGSAI